MKTVPHIDTAFRFKAARAHEDARLQGIPSCPLGYDVLIEHGGVTYAVEKHGHKGSGTSKTVGLEVTVTNLETGKATQLDVIAKYRTNPKTGQITAHVNLKGVGGWKGWAEAHAGLVAQAAERSSKGKVQVAA